MIVSDARAFESTLKMQICDLSRENVTNGDPFDEQNERLANE